MRKRKKKKKKRRREKSGDEKVKSENKCAKQIHVQVKHVCLWVFTLKEVRFTAEAIHTLVGWHGMALAGALCAVARMSKRKFIQNTVIEFIPPPSKNIFASE